MDSAVSGPILFLMKLKLEFDLWQVTTLILFTGLLLVVTNGNRVFLKDRSSENEYQN